MAVFVLVYDANDQLVGIERRENDSLRDRLRAARELARVSEIPVTFQPPFDPQLFSFQGIAHDIRDSNRLTDAQRDQLRAIIDTFHVGDQLQTARLPPVSVKVGDGQPPLRPVIAVFVDP